MTFIPGGSNGQIYANSTQQAIYTGCGGSNVVGSAIVIENDGTIINGEVSIINFSTNITATQDPTDTTRVNITVEDGGGDCYCQI